MSTNGTTNPTASENSASAQGVFLALKLEVRPCLSHILGCVELLKAEIKRLGIEELASDLQKIESATHTFYSSFEHLIDANGNPAPGADARTVRHELRTPVGHMVGYGEILLEELTDHDGTAALQSDLERMLKSARQLLAIVNDSLDFSSNGDRSLPEESQQTSSLSLAAELSPLTEAEILLVDDNEANRDLLARYLSSHGLVVTQVANGKLALEKMEGANFDLVLLDIMMPEMDGYQVLEYMKNDESLRHIPVIMISAINELENVVSCIGMGATDYLTKPFNPVLLHARVQSSLERKKWRDQEQHYLQQLEIEQAKSETLLLNILPAPIANRLKRKQGVIADNFEEATVLFADVISFTTTSSRLAPSTLVKSLNILFSTFDSIADEYGLEKIKTIGDAYMAACGIPIPREDHAQAVVEAALDMLDETERIASKLVHPFKIRIGISSGPVTAGVIGKKKFCYDLWGDTVNTASRMSGIGETPHVRITESTFQYAKDHFKLSAPELFEVKGKGNMASFVVLGRKED